MSRFQVYDHTVHRFAGVVLSLLALALPLKVMAHPGHGNEFEGNSPSTESTGAIQVDNTTAKRLGLQVEPVSRQRLTFGIITTGKIEALPNQQVEVTTPVMGTVIKLWVKPGDRVAAGQPVAVMTTPELAELRTTAMDRRTEAIGAVQQAEIELLLAQQNLEQQRKIVAANIKQAQSQVNFAQERYEKDQTLAANGAIPRRTFLESETKLAEAKASLAKATSALEVSAAQAQLRSAQSALEVARSRVSLSDQTYQTRLRQLRTRPNADGTVTLTAPISGVVTDIETTQGESGQDAGKKVMTIVNSRSVQISGNIYEKDLTSVQVGQTVRVKPNGMPNRVFKGQINVVGTVVEKDSRVVSIKAELDNSDGALKSGLFAELEVLTNRTPVAVLAIPKSAIVETNQKKQVVFVQNGTGYEATEVTLGRESGNLVEVKSGLFDGDRVVTQRAKQLYTQSLRSGATPVATNNHNNPAITSSATMPDSLPWWVMLPVGGAIVTGTFWAGTLWAKSRSQRLTINPPLNGNSLAGYENETHLNHTDQLDGTPSKHPDN